MVMSLLFIILLRFVAGIMVWVMIVMVILVLGYGASPLPSPQSAKCQCSLTWPWRLENLLRSHQAATVFYLVCFGGRCSSQHCLREQTLGNNLSAHPSGMA